MGAAPWAPQDAPCRRSCRPRRDGTGRAVPPARGEALRRGRLRRDTSGRAPTGRDKRRAPRWVERRTFSRTVTHLRVCSPEKGAGTPVPGVAGRLPLCHDPRSAEKSPSFLAFRERAAGAGAAPRFSPVAALGMPRRSSRPAAPPPSPSDRAVHCSHAPVPHELSPRALTRRGPALAAPLGGDGAAVPLPVFCRCWE